MTLRATLRASDADREAVAERLRVAATEGRLLPEELDERIGRALTARTYGQLDVLVSDLPPTDRVALRPASRSITPRRAGLAAVALAFLLIAALASAFGGDEHGIHHGGGAWVIWLVWLAIGWRVFTRRRRGR